MGYFLRLTEANAYSSPYWILNNLGWKVDLKNRGWKKLITYWQSRKVFCQLVGKTSNELACLELENQGWETVELFSQQISYSYIHFCNSRICPECLSEVRYYRKIWDLVFITACPHHKKLLVNTCSRCKNNINWNRNKIGFCSCGFDLKYAEAESVNSDELTHNLIAFEILNVDTSYNLDLLIKFNPLRNIPIKFYIDFLVSIMNFLSVKENNGILLKTTSNKFWHSYSLKVVNFFEDYPHNIVRLFKEGGTESEDFVIYSKFINAIKNCSDNPYLFFILIAFSEYENKTCNYPEIQDIHNLKDNYIRADKIVENLGIDREVLSVLHEKGLFISFKEYLGFIEHKMYITRNSLDIIREKIKTNVDINAASELLRLTYKQTIQLIKAGILRPTKDPYFSDAMNMRFNLDDIENLIKKFGIIVNQPLVEIKNGGLKLNKPENELALILDSIDALDSQYGDKNVKQAEDSGLFPFPLSRAELEKYLADKQQYFTQIEKTNLRKAAKFLNAKLEDENTRLTRRFNYDKSPFSIGIDEPQILALTFKKILVNARADYL